MIVDLFLSSFESLSIDNLMVALGTQYFYWDTNNICERAKMHRNQRSE